MKFKHEHTVNETEMFSCIVNIMSQKKDDFFFCLVQCETCAKSAVPTGVYAVRHLRN